VKIGAETGASSSAEIAPAGTRSLSDPRRKQCNTPLIDRRFETAMQQHYTSVNRGHGLSTRRQSTSTPLATSCCCTPQGSMCTCICMHGDCINTFGQEHSAASPAPGYSGSVHITSTAFAVPSESASHLGRVCSLNRNGASLAQ
jgi:hypothetical protein